MSLKNIGVKLDGTHTDIVIGNYENKILIVITQTQKFGSVIKVEREIFKALEGQENVFNIQTIFGKDCSDNYLIVRILSENIGTTKPIIFVLNLKDTSPRTVKALIKVLDTNRIW